MIKSFFAALSFISRLPVPARLSQGLEIEQYQRSIVTFPLVGLLLGAIAGAVALLLQPWCGVPLAALFGVLALALLTGGFHLDGLADTCDGIFSARTRDRMLEIMRDSRLGTHGGLALIFVLVAKVLVVGELLLRPLVCAICFDDRLKLVPFTQQPRRAGRIIVQIRRGQAHFQLVEPRGQHFQFLKHNLSPNRAIHQRPVSISPIMEQYSRQRTAAH